MKKRKWVYCQHPSAYSISCDLCGGEVEWSEYEGCVWCEKCQKDTPGTGGIFNSPIPFEVAKMFGLSFDKIDIKTKKRLYIKEKDNKLVWEENP